MGPGNRRCERPIPVCRWCLVWALGIQVTSGEGTPQEGSPLCPFRGQWQGVCHCVIFFTDICHRGPVGHSLLGAVRHATPPPALLPSPSPPQPPPPPSPPPGSFLSCVQGARAATCPVVVGMASLPLHHRAAAPDLAAQGQRTGVPPAGAGRALTAGPDPVRCLGKQPEAPRPRRYLPCLLLVGLGTGGPCSTLVGRVGVAARAMLVTLLSSLACGGGDSRSMRVGGGQGSPPSLPSLELWLMVHCVLPGSGGASTPSGGSLVGLLCGLCVERDMVSSAGLRGAEQQDVWPADGLRVGGGPAKAAVLIGAAWRRSFLL